MTTITDLRKKAASRPLTFGELKVGEWFEWLVSSAATCIKTDTDKFLNTHQEEILLVDGNECYLNDGVVRLDVEIVIKGELP